MLEKLLRRLEKRRERYKARQEMKEFLRARALNTRFIRGGLTP